MSRGAPPRTPPPLDDEGRARVVDCYGQAVNLARSLPGDLDENLELALEALCLLAGEYDAARGAVAQGSFHGFVSRHLRLRTIDLWRRYEGGRPEKGPGSDHRLPRTRLDAPLRREGSGDTLRIELADTLAADASPFDERVCDLVEAERLAALVDELPDARHRDVLRHFAASDDAGNVDLAAAWSVTPSRVSQVYTQARATLRAYAEERCVGS